MAAKKSEQNTEAQDEQQMEAQEEQVVVRLNPDTGLLGYDFGDGFGASANQRYILSKSDYEKYKSERHDSKQVLVKA